MSSESVYYLGLSLVPGLGTIRIHQAVRQCGGAASALFKLARSELKRLSLPQDAVAWIAGGWALQEAEKTVESASVSGISVISFADDEYPQMLRTIYDPPVVIYCIGDVRIAQQAAVAIVGSRRASVYGRQVTQRLARELASTGLVITSGLARGIDSYAHLGALEAKGRTVAVLGNGVDIPYPRENRKIYERIKQEGCLLSEFPCGSFPAPQNFPIRNRLISGLCYGTVIAEASEFSGSLITARLTLEQNRQLWAIPGNITSPGSYGPNYLLKQGARILLDYQDVLEELPAYVLEGLRSNPEQAAPEADPVEPGAKKVLNFLPVDSSIHFDTLLSKSALGFSQLNEVLLRLEMQGLIRQLPGRQYMRVLLE